MTDPIAPIDPRDATPAERLRTLAASVREASRAAQVLTLEEAWAGTEEEYLQAVATTPGTRTARTSSSFETTESCICSLTS